MLNDNKFYKIINGKRVYNNDIDVFNLFYNEILFHFKNQLKLNTKIFYLKCSTKHNFQLNQFDLDYLSILFKRREENLNFIFSDNIKKIKCSQRNDLFFLTNLKNLDFICLLPKLDSKNFFYFELILGVSKNFNIFQFYDWNLQSVAIDNFIELNNFNLNYEQIKTIFDLEKNNFRDNVMSEDEGVLWSKHFVNKQGIDLKLTKIGVRLYKKFIFKLICVHLYWLVGDCQLDDSIFWIDGFHDNVLILDDRNNLQIEKNNEPWSFINLLIYNPEYINFNTWEMFQNK